jgi:hypothetical protein
VQRKAAEQIAAIDRELKALGIAPEAFGSAPVPGSNGELTVYTTGL